jgi:hypothetical protein
VAYAEAERRLAAAATEAAEGHGAAGVETDRTRRLGDHLEQLQVDLALRSSAAPTVEAQVAAAPAADEPDFPTRAADGVTDAASDGIGLASRVFLGVEPECVALIEINGFRARSRKNIAASCTPEEAMAGYRRYHPDEECVVFEVEMEGLLLDHVSLFTTPEGMTRLSTQHIPARFLQKL